MVIICQQVHRTIWEVISCLLISLRFYSLFSASFQHLRSSLHVITNIWSHWHPLNFTVLLLKLQTFLWEVPLYCSFSRNEATLSTVWLLWNRNFWQPIETNVYYFGLVNTCVCIFLEHIILLGDYIYFSPATEREDERS